MINLLLWLVLLALLGISAAWIAENPGDVTIYWFDWRIDTSFAFLLLMAAVTVAALSFLYLAIRRVLLTPAHVSQARQLKHYRKGLTELTYSVAALAAADAASAEAHTKKAQKHLGPTPITLLLSAQIARSRGDDEKTRLLLEQMLDHKETEYLAARSLSEAAGKQQLFSRALTLAERAQAVNPKSADSTASVVSLHIRTGQWQQALSAITRAARKGAYRSRSELRRHQGLVHLAQGMALLSNNQADAALAHVRHVRKGLSGFVPAAVFIARTQAASNQTGKAIKTILNAWKDTPHPELAAALRAIIAKAPKEKQMRQMRVLVSLRPDHPESELALAEAAIKHQEWEVARKALKSVLDREDRVQACKLMAYVEQGEFSDFDAAGRWLKRSSEAAPDPAWTCKSCGQAAQEWHTHCPACGAFDTLEWKHRAMQFVG